jgi:hypothetical protein
MAWCSIEIVFYSFLAYFHHIEERNVGLWDHHYQLVNAWTNRYKNWYAYHGTWAHINGVIPRCHPSICGSVYVPLLSLLGKGSVNTFPGATNTHKNRWIVWRVIFYRSMSISKESGGLCVSLLWLLDNSRVNMFPRQYNCRRRLSLCDRVVSKAISSSHNLL